jgi:putative transposase
MTMWTPITRKHHTRCAARYQTDLTDGEWQFLEPLVPAPLTAGRPRKWAMREIINAIFYVLRGGIAWRLLPSDFPPWQTVYRWFAAFRDGCVFEKINHALVMADRERAGRQASPTAAIIDSQSVKTTESGGPRGYDAGKKINGRKRHALVDTDGRALLVEPHPADIQDRDGGGPLLQMSRAFFPFVRHVWADGGYNHARVSEATSIVVEIVKKQPDQSGFVVLPRRWVVERFFAWINRNRRLAKDFEATIKSAAAFLYAASAMLLVRRLARAT